MSDQFKEKILELAEAIRRFKRAMQGLPLDDDVFSGLLNVKDERERTRLSEHDVYGHSYMRILAEMQGDEWEILKKIAEQEDIYFISLEGEQRKEAILMQRAKAEILMPSETLKVPQVETKPQEQQQKKGRKLF